MQRWLGHRRWCDLKMAVDAEAIKGREALRAMGRRWGQAVGEEKTKKTVI